MPTKAARTAKRETLNLRIPSDERRLIDSAARLTGKTRTDFVIEAAHRAAEEALLDQVVFRVGQNLTTSSWRSSTLRHGPTNG
jgi:uncharacterized protein (DUF1778 family)